MAKQAIVDAVKAVGDEIHMPWVWYTHISHTNSGKKENATPLFDWGRYFERNGRWLLSFSV